MSILLIPFDTQTGLLSIYPAFFAYNIQLSALFRCFCCSTGIYRQCDGYNPTCCLSNLVIDEMLVCGCFLVVDLHDE